MALLRFAIPLAVIALLAVACDTKRQSCGREGQNECTTSSPPCDDGLELDPAVRRCVKKGSAHAR
jgi:hypothetical protein